MFYSIIRKAISQCNYWMSNVTHLLGRVQKGASEALLTSSCRATQVDEVLEEFSTERIFTEN